MQKMYKGAGTWIGIMIVVMIISFILQTPSAKMTYSELINQINNENVSKIITDENKLTCYLKDSDVSVPFTVNIPSYEALQKDCGEQIAEQMKQGQLNIQHYKCHMLGSSYIAFSFNDVFCQRRQRRWIYKESC